MPMVKIVYQVMSLSNRALHQGSTPRDDRVDLSRAGVQAVARFSRLRFGGMQEVSQDWHG